MPGAHGARTEGRAFLGHLLSALGQLRVRASAGGKEKLVWNMEKQPVGIKRTLLQGIQKPGRIPAVAFFPRTVAISHFRRLLLHRSHSHSEFQESAAAPSDF